jgi:hypothetical protein
MKRVITMLLVLCMFFPLCAAASADTKNVEALMLAADAASDESISSAKEAYNSLTENEKEQVSEKAKEALFQARLMNLANQIIEFDKACEYITITFGNAWATVGGQDVLGCMDAVRIFFRQPIKPLSETEYTLTEYIPWLSVILGKECNEKDVEKMLYVAAKAINPGALYWRDGKPMPLYWVSDDKIPETIKLCVEYNENEKYVKDNKDTLPEIVREFRKDYKSQYPDEVSTIDDWLIESQLFADFALNPYGDLKTFESEATEHLNTIRKILKIMDTYY